MCQSSVSAFIVDYTVRRGDLSPFSGLVRGLGKLAGVYVHHCHEPAHLRLSAGPADNTAGKIGFPPMAIRRTVRADSSLLTKA